MTTRAAIAMRVRDLVSQVLDVPVDSIGQDFSQETAASWTSLNHLMLISQIESEFGLTFSNQEIREATSFQRIVEALASRHRDVT